MQTAITVLRNLLPWLVILEMILAEIKISIIHRYEFNNIFLWISRVACIGAISTCFTPLTIFSSTLYHLSLGMLILYAIVGAAVYYQEVYYPGAFKDMFEELQYVLLIIVQAILVLLLSFVF